MFAKGKTLTVKDVILFEAHVMGGVHAGEARTDLERATKEISDNLTLFGYRASLRQLKAIARVVVKGVEQLLQSVGN